MQKFTASVAAAGGLVAALAAFSPSAHAATTAPLTADQVFSTWQEPTAAQETARQSLDPAVLQALNRLTTTTGAPSAADQATLANYHDLADAFSQGSDSTETDAGVTTDSSWSGMAHPLAGSGCGWREGTVSRRTGWPDYSLEYKWHSHLDTCWNGRAVSYINSQYTYVTNQMYGWKFDGPNTSSVGSPGHWSLVDFQQGHMEYCFLKYGCLQDLYPAVQITQYGDGETDYSRWKTG